MLRFVKLPVAGFLLALLFGLEVAAQENTDGPLPPGPHVELVYAKCQSCHSLNKVVDSIGLPAFLWEDTVDLMIQLGMQVTDEERADLTEYLTTYLGPDGPPETTDGDTEVDATAQTDPVDGEALYATNCSGCHQTDGRGVPGAFPPLVEHAPALYRADGGRAYLVALVLYGLQGEIEVLGDTYRGVMPPWGHLSDRELAAILDHVLTTWGNEALLPDFAPYAAEEIAAERGRGLSAEEVRGLRPEIAGE